MPVCFLPSLAVVGFALSVTAAQPGPSAQPGGPPGVAIDYEKDQTLQKIRAAVDPSEEQWKVIVERFYAFRNQQRTLMREIRRSVLGDAAGPQGRPPQPLTPEQRAAMEKQIEEKVNPLTAAMLKDLREPLTAEQRTKFDEAVKGLDFSPPRGGSSAAPAVSLPPNTVAITVKDGVRTIVANGIPDHKTGQFPGRGNPNMISAQSYTFRMPEKPKVNEQATPHRMYLAGVALNGVVFDPGTAEAWKNDPRTGWRIEAIAPKAAGHMDLGIDSSNAHVQPSGAYHYHAAPEGLIEAQCKLKGVKDGEAMILLGWSADGFPIYDHHCYSKADDAKSPIKEVHSSYRLKKGTRPDEKATPPGPGGAYDGLYTQDYEFVAGSGDLDECNGRFGVTPEFPEGTYYYVITGEFPYVSRMFRGTPDASFTKRDGPPGAGGGRNRGQRPGGGPGGGPGATPPAR